MSFVTRFVRHPRKLGLRRVFFQTHVWAGLFWRSVSGLYFGFYKQVTTVIGWFSPLQAMVAPTPQPASGTGRVSLEQILLVLRKRSCRGLCQYRSRKQPRVAEAAKKRKRWRTDRDSNPGYLAVYTLSKRAPSATRPSVHGATQPFESTILEPYQPGPKREPTSVPCPARTHAVPARRFTLIPSLPSAASAYDRCSTGPRPITPCRILRAATSEEWV